MLDFIVPEAKTSKTAGVLRKSGRGEKSYVFFRWRGGCILGRRRGLGTGIGAGLLGGAAQHS